MFWVFFCACCREKASTFCELYCRKDAAFHLKDFWTVAHVICVVAGGQGCRWKPKTIRWSSGNEAGEPHTRTVLRAPVYAAEDNLGDLGSPDLLPWLQGSTWQLRGQWGPNPAHLSLVAYMFAGWGDEAKPVCVLKSLQLAGLQMGSSTVGDAWLFLLLVLQAPPQILNEEIVVLWTRIHGEMSSVLLQGHSEGEGKACLADTQGLSLILLWHWVCHLSWCPSSHLGWRQAKTA